MCGAWIYKVTEYSASSSSDIGVHFLSLETNNIPRSMYTGTGPNVYSVFPSYFFEEGINNRPNSSA